MTFASMLDARTIQALGWALLHFLWQGAAAAVVLAIAGTLAARRSASARYALALATLAFMAMLPILTFGSLMDASRGVEPSGALVATMATAHGPEATAPLADGPGNPATDRLTAALPLLVGAWAVGVALLSVRVLGGWTVARRLARSGRPVALVRLDAALERLCEAMRIARPVRLLESARVEVPTVIGWLRPVILFPAATLVGLTPAQLEVVLAHELAHIRRLDYLVNLLQTAVETLLFYHPAVWWVSHRVRVEREHCCDDAAVAACGDAKAYAEALTDLDGLRESGAGFAMAADGGSLVERVARLVARNEAHTHRASRALGALLALVAVPALVAGPAWLEARAQSQPEPSIPAAVEPAQEAAGAAASEPSASRPAPASPATQPRLTIEQVLELARAGVTPEYLEEMAAAGYPSLSWQQMIELRSQGVGPEFVRGLQEQGLRDLSLSDLISLRSQGVGPEFIQELKTAGYQGLSANALITLRSQGVTGAFATELKALGHEDLSTTQLIALRSQGVTPDYVRELKDLGYDGLATATLMQLRSQGVTPEYVREVKDAGYGGLSPDELIELRSNGVGAELLRRLRPEPRPEPRPDPRPEGR